MGLFRLTFRRSICAPAPRSASRIDSVADGRSPACRLLVPLLVVASFAVSACAMFGSNQGEDELQFGVRAYEDGELAYSARLLQSGLDSGLRYKADKVRAHKYLAFIHCASSRIPQCRDEFRKALE